MLGKQIVSLSRSLQSHHYSSWVTLLKGTSKQERNNLSLTSHVNRPWASQMTRWISQGYSFQFTFPQQPSTEWPWKHAASKRSFLFYIHMNKQTKKTNKLPHQNNNQPSAAATGAFLQSCCCWRGTFRQKAQQSPVCTIPVWTSTSTSGDKGGLCDSPQWYWDVLFSLYLNVSIGRLQSQKEIPASTSIIPSPPFPQC